MATVMEYAEMANAVYEDNPQVSGWERGPMQSSGSGVTNAFQGVIFRKGGETVVAFKGTSNPMDVAADVKLAVGMNTYQYSSARDFVQEHLAYQRTNVSLCGHSLGGAIAQVIGNRMRMPFVTFNAPGVGLFSRNILETAATVATGSAAIRMAGTITSAVMHPVQAARDAAAVFNVVSGANFRLGSDVVGSTGVHFGRVIEIPYSGGALDVVTKHLMGSVIAALETSRYKNMSLESVVG